MVKKKKRKKRKKTPKKGKKKERKIQKKEKKTEAYRIEVSQMQSDVKNFIKKFKSDVEKKRRVYQLSAQKLRKKKC